MFPREVEIKKERVKEAPGKVAEMQRWKTSTTHTSVSLSLSLSLSARTDASVQRDARLESRIDLATIQLECGEKCVGG